MSLAADLPLRPLLYAAGAAAAAAGGFYYIQKRRDGERRAEHADTSLPQDPVQKVSVDVSLLDSGSMSDVDGLRVTQTDSAVPEDSLSKAEEKNQKVHVSSGPVDSERSSLEDRVRELEELLCEALSECERKTKDYEAECQAHSTLKSQYNDMKETLTHREELLKVTLAEAEEKYEQVMESNARLETEKLDLVSQVNTLCGSVQQLQEELSETRRKRDEMATECAVGQGILTFVKSKADAQVKILKQKTESLQASLDEAERKYAEAMGSITELENGTFDLMGDMNILQESVNDLEEQLSEAQRRCNEATRERERKSQELRELDSKWTLFNETVLKDYEDVCLAHITLISQYSEMKEQHEKLLKVTLAEAEEKYEQAMESNAQLENEKSDLIYHMHKLGSTVQQLEEMLCEADIACNVIKQDCERAREAYSILKSQYEETLKQRDDLLKVSLAEAEKKYEPAVGSSAQLESENSDLMSQVNTLQSTVQQLEEELSETRRQCEEITMEREREREAHSILKMQYNEMRETLIRCDELLNNHRIALGSEEPVVL